MNDSAAASPAISLPRGGGALHGIGEKFAPDLHTGTGNFTVPIAIPPGRKRLDCAIHAAYMAERALAFELQEPVNPDLVSAPQQPMVVTLGTRREDFPPNVDDLAIEHVALYFASPADPIPPVDIGGLFFTAERGAARVGGATTAVDGLARPRQPSDANWTAMIGKSPVGQWELALPDTQEMRDRFETNEDGTEDILFVITHAGRTLPWPD